MLDPTPQLLHRSTTPTLPRELAIARSLLSLLADRIGDADVGSAADLAEQLAEHLRRIGGRDA